ncbi:MAG: hemolysin III family protein [Clostridia bacterium]|nr:hemolysin III family protein [Clostridia bacterium]
MLYSLGEEIFNAITHGIGAALSIAALTALLVLTVINGGTTIDIAGMAIYGITLIILYTMSTLYHAITNEKAKRVLRIIDHSSVYILIIGSFVPYIFTVLKGYGAKPWIVFWSLLFIAVLGTVLYSIFRQKVKIFNIVSYLLMGWALSILMPDLIEVFQSLNMMYCLYLLIIGGLFYTIGVIFYAIKKVKYFHSIWHLFVLVGSILHFIAVLCYVLHM